MSIKSAIKIIGRGAQWYTRFEVIELMEAYAKECMAEKRKACQYTFLQAGDYQPVEYRTGCGEILDLCDEPGDKIKFCPICAGQIEVKDAKD